jgi:tRNA-dihydrouridine synthase C
MIGRGVLARPDLPKRIKQMQAGTQECAMSWQEVAQLLVAFFDLSKEHYDDEYLGNPIKQWLVYLKKGYQEMSTVFDTVKKLHQPEQVRDALLYFADGNLPG